VVFENVGGDVLDAGLMCLNHRARVVLCGLIAEYNRAEGPLGARNLWQLIVQSASIHGMLIRDYLPRFGEGAAAMAAWVRDGKLVFDEHVDTGIENALPAFLRLFAGTNEGKMILKLA
jgi:NADPH-dependent curcumin reductase CurA